MQTRRSRVFDRAPLPGGSRATGPLLAPAQLAAHSPRFFYVTLPNKLTIGPNWLVPVLEVLVFVALVLTTPGDGYRAHGCAAARNRALIRVLALVSLVALGLLAHYVVEGGAAGRGLVEAAVAL